MPYKVLVQSVHWAGNCTQEQGVESGAGSSAGAFGKREDTRPGRATARTPLDSMTWQGGVWPCVEDGYQRRAGGY